MNSTQVFQLGMRRLGIAFGRDVTQAVLEVYWEVLQRRSPIELADAFRRAATECKFFPPPAELLELSGVALPMREEREREARRISAQAEIDEEVRRTNATLDSIFGRTPKGLPPSAENVHSVVRTLADGKSVR